jgi:hypothetical protein
MVWVAVLVVEQRGNHQLRVLAAVWTPVMQLSAIFFSRWST